MASIPKHSTPRYLVYHISGQFFSGKSRLVKYYNLARQILYISQIRRPQQKYSGNDDFISWILFFQVIFNGLCHGKSPSNHHLGDQASYANPSGHVVPKH